MRIVSRVLGNAWMQPAVETLLECATLGRGIRRELDGETFRVSPKNRWLWTEAKEPELRAFMKSRVAPGGVLLDVGAHVGLYALLFTRWSVGGRVHAFEPNPTSRSLLQRHVALNGLAERVLVCDAAVSDRAGKAEFHAAPYEGMSRLGRAHAAIADQSVQLSVDTVTIDEYCAAHDVRPTWLRMDIEGNELAALRGARETIRSRGKELTIVVEMHPNVWSDFGSSAEEARALLASLNLRAVPLSGQRDPIGDYGIVHLAHD
jgi:FkbM family methyltransferase